MSEQYSQNQEEPIDDETVDIMNSTTSFNELSNDQKIDLITHPSEQVRQWYKDLVMADALFAVGESEQQCQESSRVRQQACGRGGLLAWMKSLAN